MACFVSFRLSLPNSVKKTTKGKKLYWLEQLTVACNNFQNIQVPRALSLQYNKRDLRKGRGFSPPECQLFQGQIRPLENDVESQDNIKAVL